MSPPGQAAELMDSIKLPVPAGKDSGGNKVTKAMLKIANKIVAKNAIPAICPGDLLFSFFRFYFKF